MLVENLPPAFGGAARQALALAEELRCIGISIFFASAMIVPESLQFENLRGFQVYRVPHIASGKWIKFKKVLSYCTLLWKRRNEFNILHIHGPYYLTLGVGFFAQRILGKQVVLKLTSVDVDTPSAVKRGMYPAISWFFYRQADAFVCISTAQWEDCRAHGLPDDRLFRIPNGVDAERFRPLVSAFQRVERCRQIELPSDCVYGVFIGSIVEDKGIRLLVEAAVKVCAVRHDVCFLLIGPDGGNPGEAYISERFVERIRNRINEAGLQKRVRLLGRRDNPSHYLQAASFFVFPSRSEGFGTALIEGMATSLPVVALRIPGVTADIVTNDFDGLIIDAEDPNLFASAILRLVSDKNYADRLGKSARDTVLARFSFASVSRQYAELYGRLVDSL